MRFGLFDPSRAARPQPQQQRSAIIILLSAALSFRILTHPSFATNVQASLAITERKTSMQTAIDQFGNSITAARTQVQNINSQITTVEVRPGKSRGWYCG